MSDTPREIPPEHAHIAAYAYPYLWEYHLGVAGEGEHAYTWQDKPHRLVFNLTSRCAFLERENAALREALEPFAKVASSMDGYNEGLATFVAATCVGGRRVFALDSLWVKHWRAALAAMQEGK